MTKEELDLEKNDFREIELQQSKIWTKIREQERKRFDECDLISIIAKNKNDDDLQVLMEKFTEWINLIKNDSSKKSAYFNLLKSVYRIHSYCFNIETTVKQAISQLKTEEEIKTNTLKTLSKEKLLLINKINLLEQKTKELEAEIEFITKNG